MPLQGRFYWVSSRFVYSQPGYCRKTPVTELPTITAGKKNHSVLSSVYSHVSIPKKLSRTEAAIGSLPFRQKRSHGGSAPTYNIMGSRSIRFLPILDPSQL